MKDDSDKTSKVKDMVSRAGGAIKGWFGKTKDAVQSGVSKMKRRSHRAES